jgi:two-component system sensor histidine kinase KdpD
LAQTVVDEVGLLSTMTENTLQLARLDTTGIHIQRDWESLEELVGTAVSRVRKRYPAMKMNLRVATGLPLFRCNAELMVQLLNNLVDNAVKYGGTEQTIEIMARRHGDQLLLAVADRGPGMPVAARERMFTAYVRGDERQRLPGAARGSGLGLALCRAISAAHGGTIQACSRQRGGTRMECLFPTESQPDSPTGEPAL